MSNERPVSTARRVACVSILLIAGAAHAQLADFAQVTETPFGFGMFEPSLSADGSRIAFRTTADFTGQNSDGSFEVFLYDEATDSLTQLTSTPGGGGTAIDAPMITPDGSSVVFRSLWDFNTQAPGATFQLWEVGTEGVASGGTPRQVTANPPGTPVFDPRLSGDGRFAVFLSRIDPTGQNSDGSLEVFRTEIASGTTIQISDNGFAAAQFPDINGNGSRIVWADRNNYDGSNTSGGLEIWLWDAADGISAVTDQPTSGLETTLPRIDHAGRFVCFVSLFDFSGSGAIGRKVHVADTADGSIELITDPGVGGSGENVPDAEIAPDGSAVYFESNRNLADTGEATNPDGNRELFAYDTATGGITQLTDTTGGVSIVQLSDDATRRYVDISTTNRIAYRSEQSLDPSTANAGGNLDLFLSAATEPPCLPDANGDGNLDPADFNAWVLAFNTQAPACDQNGDGQCTPGDFNAWVLNFNNGC
ncbi:MAG: GC-type dockerin domain-anchored protein [Planctomycetota bacterium]